MERGVIILMQPIAMQISIAGSAQAPARRLGMLPAVREYAGSLDRVNRPATA